MIIVPPQKVLYLHKQLAKRNPKLEGETFIITEKYNGWMVLFDYHVKEGWEFPKSSALRPIPAFEWMKEELNSFYGTLSYNIRLITEAIIPNKEFTEINGIFNRSVGNYHCKDAVFILHDVIFIDKYQKILSLNAYDRSNHLPQFTYSNLNIIKVPIIHISEFNHNKFIDIFENQVSNGAEGIILKNVNGVYSPGKRNASLLKMKVEETHDLQILKYYKTTGEKGEEGYNIVCNFRGNETTVRVGKYSDQNIIITLGDNIIGKYATIKAMMVSPQGNLLQPVFQHFRFDK